jgi:RNA polymerase sigma factor (sigma-70 family)
MLLKSALEPIIAQAFSDAQLRFGDLGLDLPAYTQRVLAIVRKHLGAAPSLGRAIDFVKQLNWRDLYLATACAQTGLGPDSSNSNCTRGESCSLPWRTLENIYKGFICDLVRFFCRRGSGAEDLADSILTDLFLPDRWGRSRIASYDARSSLSTWLRVVVCNRAINARRSVASNTTDLEPGLPDKCAFQNIELALRARRYGAALEDSLASACQALTARERLILLWRYQDGLQLGEIAKLLGIHQCNVTRQLEKMQTKLRDDLTTILCDKYGLSPSAIHECLEDMVENPLHQIPVLDFVKTADGAGLPPLPATPKHSTPLKHSWPVNITVKPA